MKQNVLKQNYKTRKFDLGYNNDCKYSTFYERNFSKPLPICETADP